jgi:hypothetical protein
MSLRRREAAAPHTHAVAWRMASRFVAVIVVSAMLSGCSFLMMNTRPHRR